MIYLIQIIRKTLINFSFLIFFKTKKFAIITFPPWAYFRKNHPSGFELRCIIKTLKNLGYSIIVVDHRRKNYKFLRLIKPKLWIGLSGFTDASRIKNLKNIIFYSTGACSNYVSLEVKKLLKLNSNLPFNSLHFRTSENFNYVNIKKIILIGSNWTRLTFDKSTIKKIKLIKPFHKKIVTPINTSKSYSIKIKAIKNILWVGSKGIVHKGFWQAVVLAKKLNAKLTCIGIPKDEIKLSKNLLVYLNYFHVDLHGFIKFGTDKLSTIVTKCDSMFFYSLSEGTSTTILEFGQYGLPLITNDRSGVEGVTSIFFGFKFKGFEDEILTKLESFVSAVDLKKYTLIDPGKELTEAIIEAVNNK